MNKNFRSGKTTIKPLLGIIMSNNREKDKKDKISRHWCGNLGASVILMESDRGESKCLSSHLCGGDSAHCGKHSQGGGDGAVGGQITM